tara:strand:- start:13319 stop:13597 length:279 start_codon:yes stop_codon:yes gene_type:complete
MLPMPDDVKQEIDRLESLLDSPDMNPVLGCYKAIEKLNAERFGIQQRINGMRHPYIERKVVDKPNLAANRELKLKRQKEALQRALKQVEEWL